MKNLSSFLAVVMLMSLAKPALAGYGSIYYSQSSRYYGYSWNHRTQEAAENAAYGECRKKAKDCRGLWFRDACGALALGREGGWGADWGYTINEAERKAIATCTSYNNSSCTIEISFCTQ